MVIGKNSPFLFACTFDVNVGKFKSLKNLKIVGCFNMLGTSAPDIVRAVPM